MQTISMHHLLVPYDFSETSQKTLRHAANMATNLKARISLLNVKEEFSVEQVLHTSTSNIDLATYKQNVVEKLAVELRKLKEQYTVKLDTYVMEGKVSRQVSEFVKNNDVSMVIIGTHGVKGRDSFFLGSNTYKIVNNTKIPVLTVTNEAQQLNYKHIAMPLDSSFHTREKIPYACQMAAAYNARLHVVGLQTHHDKESVQKMHAILNQTEKYIESCHVDFSIELRDSKNLASDTLKFAEDVNADLMVIMSEQERSFSGLFLGPYSQQIINHAMIPVLTIPPRVSLVMTDVSV